MDNDDNIVEPECGLDQCSYKSPASKSSDTLQKKVKYLIRHSTVMTIFLLGVVQFFVQVFNPFGDQSCPKGLFEWTGFCRLVERIWGGWVGSEQSFCQKD